MNDAKEQARRNFARIVKEVWDATGLKQQAFADLMHISRPGLLNWVNAVVDDPLEVSTRRLETLAAMRNQTIDELIRDIRGEEVKGEQPTPKFDAWMRHAPDNEFYSSLSRVLALAAIRAHHHVANMSTSPDPVLSEFQRMFSEATERQGGLFAMASRLEIPPGTCQEYLNGDRLPTPAETENLLGWESLFTKPDGSPYTDNELILFSRPPFPGNQPPDSQKNPPRTNGAHS